MRNYIITGAVIFVLLCLFSFSALFYMVAAAFFAILSVYVIRRTAKEIGNVGLIATAVCIGILVLIYEAPSGAFSVRALTLSVHIFVGALSGRIIPMVYSIAKEHRAKTE